MNYEASNTRKGTLFEDEVEKALADTYGYRFNREVGIGIGSPPKRHRFDLVDPNTKTVVECKALTWTSSGNMPSAKITTTREAVFYLQWLPEEWTKIVAMSRSLRFGYDESLAEYFVRLNGHLLGDVRVIEVDGGEARMLQGTLARSLPKSLA